jgi:hypothetical protein
MGITPIERLKAWFAGRSYRCMYCKSEGTLLPSDGGYRYCSAACAEADLDAQVL